MAFEHPIRQLTILRTPHSVENSISSKDSNLINLFFTHLYDSIEAKLKTSPALYDAKLYISSPNKYKERFVTTDFGQRTFNYTISIQSVTLEDTVFTDIYISPGQNGELVGEKVVVHQLSYAVTFRINNMALLETNKSITVNDTTQWVSPDITSKNKSLHYVELANIVASHLMEKMVPYWVTAERQIYYVPNQQMRKGYKYFVANELNAAIKQWQVVYNIGTKPLASKAAFNIALSYELMDNLQASHDWLNNAIQLKNDSVFMKYQQVIDKRMEEQAQLDKQLWK